MHEIVMNNSINLFLISVHLAIDTLAASAQSFFSHRANNPAK
jgi:hypothetical protein